MRSRSIRIVLVIFLCLAAVRAADAQSAAYCLSDVAWDSASGRVTSISSTWLNFAARLHYDPAVVGGMFREGYLLEYARDTGNGDTFAAIIDLGTTTPSPPDTRYDIVSDHYMVPYFYTDIVIRDEDMLLYNRRGKPAEGTPVAGKPGQKRLRGYDDPMGFGGFGGGSYPGWKAFRGSTNYGGLQWDYQYFYIGTTGKGIVTNAATDQIRD